MKRCLREDDGFTLVELVIASALSLMIAFSALSMMDGITRSERGAQARYDATSSVREAMMRATKELRQATAVNPSSSQSTLDVQTLLAGTAKRLTFDVSGTDIRRTICANFAFSAPCGGSAAIVLSRVTNLAPFCYVHQIPASGTPAPCDTTPTSIKGIRIEFAATPDLKSTTAPVRLASDVQLRNASS